MGNIYMTYDEFINGLRTTAIREYSKSAAHFMMTVEKTKLREITDVHHMLMDVLNDTDLVQHLYEEYLETV